MCTWIRNYQLHRSKFMKWISYMIWNVPYMDFNTVSVIKKFYGHIRK